MSDLSNVTDANLQMAATECASHDRARGTGKLGHRLCIPAVATLFVLGLALAAPRRAEAQYSHGIHYDNGRYAYSQNWSLGRNGYSGGWSIQTPRYGYSTGYSYGGGRHVYGSQYRSGGRVYGQGYPVGRGHYSGSTYYRRRY